MTPATSQTGTSSRSIQLRGVRVHNLKSIDVDIPLDQLVVISGVSGSGKSSLAFDTLVAEGQRRYLETFSISARQHLERVEKPNADRIAHVPVTIAIRSGQSQRTHQDPRSTVGSLAGLLDSLRFLFARIGKVICLDCGCEVKSQSPADVSKVISEQPSGTRVVLAFVADRSNRSASGTTWLAKGFSRAIWNGTTHDLNALADSPQNDGILIVVDRLIAGRAETSRMMESAELAFREGAGRCVLLIEQIQPADQHHLVVDNRNWRRVSFSRQFDCPNCGRHYLPPEPQLFSHFSYGACGTCHGTGIDSQSAACGACQGTRFRAQALAVRINGKSIAHLCSLTATGMLQSVNEFGVSLPAKSMIASARIREELVQRMTIVNDLGLDYLTLDRSVTTLSGGECRRLMLAAAIGSRLTGTLVVIDEPTAGLHPTEIPSVTAGLRQLIGFRNSVIAVDHSPQLAAAADHLLELGPAAGPNGGNVIYQGPPLPVTAQPVNGHGSSKNPSAAKRKRSNTTLVAIHINHRHFHDRQFEFPLGKLSVVSGPSGSGKTTLLTEVIFPGTCHKLGLACPLPNPGNSEIMGTDGLVDVVLIDQSPLTRSARSNPATWLDVFQEIRQTFALTSDAKLLGLTPVDFSFNSPKGERCNGCLGTGSLKQDLQFLPDVTVPCPECGGTRYQRRILQVKYRGRSIADVLAMTVSEAAVFFRAQTRIQTRIHMLNQFGLDYLVLGQPSQTLSGGEVQRLKLAARLAAPNRGSCLFLCDEPTNGLHPVDVQRMIAGLQELLANGHTLIMADNSPELMSAADCVVELTRPRG